jgi:Na+-driven multidrug efflux pump
MIVMLVCWCAIRITYITIMVSLLPDIRVVFWAYPLTWFLSSVTFLIYYNKADWSHGFIEKTA